MKTDHGNASIAPLRWPFDWNHLTAWQKMLSLIPFVGPQARAHKDIVYQLRHRSAASIELWNRFSKSEVELARIISKVVKEALRWPNDYFIPDDPFEIVIWDKHGDMATTETIAAIERKIGVEQKASAEWENLTKKNYGSVVRFLSRELEKPR